ncbi:putative AAA+ superfamily ATPase [Allofrancisella inopinata]|uniref:ATP-binding protein n=1 Tax=Allofrancisella inopinata TaxID=1085647 RepID=A0AAE6YHK7_9GAMM|nr:ATP-binding protein [Allofrancisella inopinata]QIV95696.1 ATP-binding protein [Allofrancisella inopinata]TDT72153.1 putative AAA+ superfamily ATPase [Allofrancisella inopinata]
MYYSRAINLVELLAKKSFFLFGPRATGKSSLIRNTFPKETLIINLLRSELYLELSAKPHHLEHMIAAYSYPDVVVIDEIQKIPMLLNEAHRLIEEKGIRFLLTGSSARTLRRKHQNLLAGRARQAELFPLTSFEITDFNLERYLRYGGLPAIYLSDEPEEDLDAYIGTYLKEEIQIEASVRNIPGFSRFLQTAALTSGQMLNFTNIGSDVGLPPSTVREYYHILEDTFVGFLLPAYTKTIKRKAISTAKFYFFDTGVRNALIGLKSIPKQSEIYGQLFEHFIIIELRTYLSYRRLNKVLSYWRSKHGQEVDCIIGDEIALEIKATDAIKDKHYKGLLVFAEEGLCQRYIIVSHDPVRRKFKNIETIFWRDFLNELWHGEILNVE